MSFSLIRLQVSIAYHYSRRRSLTAMEAIEVSTGHFCPLIRCGSEPTCYQCLCIEKQLSDIRDDVQNLVEAVFFLEPFAIPRLLASVVASFVLCSRSNVMQLYTCSGRRFN